MRFTWKLPSFMGQYVYSEHSLWQIPPGPIEHSRMQLASACRIWHVIKGVLSSGLFVTLLVCFLSLHLSIFSMAFKHTTHLSNLTVHTFKSAMGNRQEEGTSAVHWTICIFRLSGRYLPLIEHSRMPNASLLRVTNLKYKKFYLLDYSWVCQLQPVCFLSLPLFISSIVSKRTPHLSPVSLQSQAVMLLL